MLANRINSITIRNFRSLADVTVDMEDLTVLVGANGTGKSNFLKALGFVRDVVHDYLGLALYQQGSFVPRQGAPDPERLSDVEIEIRLRLDGHDAFYSVAFGPDGRNGNALNHEVGEIGKYKYEVTCNAIASSFDLGNSIISGFPDTLTLQVAPFIKEFAPFIALNEFLANLRVYSIFPKDLRELGPQSQQRLLLADNGENLPTLLQDFVDNADDKKKQSFYEELERIVPGICTYTPFQSTSNDAISVSSISGFLVVTIRHSDSRGELFLNSESDGTIRALALLMALNQKPGPSIIGIEEPELMLHPEAMGVLADVIREASFRSQVILTTHSPDLITNFPIKSLRIVDLENGATKIGPVREDQRQIVEESLFGSGNLLRLGGLARE